jgi:hypothetical protein
MRGRRARPARAAVVRSAVPSPEVIGFVSERLIPAKARPSLQYGGCAFFSVPDDAARSGRQ